MTFAMLVNDPFAGTLALLALVWVAAKLGGEVAVRLGLPSVAGELSAGLLLAGLHQGMPGFPDVAGSPGAEVLANLGVILLMFAVGLESTVPQMLQVGVASLRVASLGVVLPMAAGLLGAKVLLPAGSPLVVDVFIGACLCATSIGISAQVLRERGAAQSAEGRVIVGAAVIDDVLGLMVLVAVSGLVAAADGGGALPWGRLGRTLGLATGFLGVALTLGRLATPHLFRLASRLRGEQVLLPLGLAFAFFLAWLSGVAGLAPIVGAYAAGLILEPAHVELLEEREAHTLMALLQPLVMVMAPIFFVLMGARVDVRALVAPSTLLLAGVLGALGVAGKFAAGFGGGRGLRASVVGWGMVPRGEVGLIFVAVGAQSRFQGGPLLSPEVQAGIVGAILLTTVAGPLGLGRVLRRVVPGGSPDTP
ncbi:cation:proton antiporter [Mesoterricola silvestris]|uniref:Na+/H+-exchanging protein n=1 Tax=Mesoterricola silvestris TaxID=2927979 RepID=A0AA48GJG0_9BACT|nr:cation:proton antiporter [Mesoterricola silvestris]BDU70844.1 Na+/H+-exchanging protein [Mesoterricola silvestris]